MPFSGFGLRTRPSFCVDPASRDEGGPRRIHIHPLELIGLHRHGGELPNGLQWEQRLDGNPSRLLLLMRPLTPPELLVAVQVWAKKDGESVGLVGRMDLEELKSQEPKIDQVGTMPCSAMSTSL